MDKPRKERRRPWFNNGLWVGLLVVILFSLWVMTRESPVQNIKYGELVQILEASRQGRNVTFRDVEVGNSDIRGKIVTVDQATDGDQNAPVTRTIEFRTLRLGLERDAELYPLLNQTARADYQGEPEESPLRVLSSFLFLAVFIVGAGIATLFVLRWVSGGSPLSFGRSRARMYAQQDSPVTFGDVAGIDEAVYELREVVDFLKRPEKYQALGGRIPKGVLLVGPPGTGKTLLAKAVAGEAGVPFFSLSGSDFVEMFVGVGAARVRDLFGTAESKAPCIIFIDELDALGKSRAGNVVGSHDEREQTLNQLLVEMDGFDSNRGVILMAATNRPETLDAALLRPGRFDRTVVVDRPDVHGREAILKVHVRDIKLGGDVDLRHVASLTPGSVGADLANLVNEAALMAARRGKDIVAMAEFNEAIERAAVGLERKSRIMQADEKRRVAYHETGHALVACSLPGTDPVHKISIIPRGVGVGGYVLSRPDDDRHLMTQSQLESTIRICLGGTIAEEIIFGDISTGATSDLQKANSIARRMVTEFGMSRMGRIYFQEGNSHAFLGASFRDGDRDYSEQTAREIDAETRRIIDEATESVRELLGQHRAALEAISVRLIQQEVMDGAEFRQYLAEFGVTLPPERTTPTHHEANGAPAA